jgi:hypothetical protein
MVTFDCLSPFVLLHDLCTKRRYPHAVSLCPLELLEQVKQVFCESPVSKVRIFSSSLVLIHPSTWEGYSQSFVFLQLSEAVTILIPFTSNSHLHPLHCAKSQLTASTVVLAVAFLALAGLASWWWRRRACTYAPVAQASSS